MMDEKLKNIENFFKLDIKIKELLYKVAPKEEDSYNDESLGKYVDNVFNALDEMSEYMEQLAVFADCSYFKNQIKPIFETYKKKLLECQYDFDKLKNFYKVCLADMNPDFVKSVSKNCIGYLLLFSPPLNEATTVNELLHVFHSAMVNNEHIYQKVIPLDQKINKDGFLNSLRGLDSEVSRNIFKQITENLSSEETDILSLSNRVLIMVRGKGHALMVEVIFENNEIVVRYFIPKICNVDMVNVLPGVKKVNNLSSYTTGSFVVSENQLVTEVVNLIKNVPSDKDMVFETDNLEEDKKIINF